MREHKETIHEMYGLNLHPKNSETKLSSKQIKQDDTHTGSVKFNDATTIKIVHKK
jgi:hypothetical protein